MNERKKALLTLRVLSTSPQGNLFTKSIPVSGVPVGGKRIEASIIKYSTFMGLICKNILTLIIIQKTKVCSFTSKYNSWSHRWRGRSCHRVLRTSDTIHVILSSLQAISILNSEFVHCSLTHCWSFLIEKPQQKTLKN